MQAWPRCLPGTDRRAGWGRYRTRQQARIRLGRDSAPEQRVDTALPSAQSGGAWVLTERVPAASALRSTRMAHGFATSAHTDFPHGGVG